MKKLFATKTIKHSGQFFFKGDEVKLDEPTMKKLSEKKLVAEQVVLSDKDKKKVKQLKEDKKKK